MTFGYGGKNLRKYEFRVCLVDFILRLQIYGSFSFSMQKDFELQLSIKIVSEVK